MSNATVTLPIKEYNELIEIKRRYDQKLLTLKKDFYYELVGLSKKGVDVLSFDFDYGLFLIENNHKSLGIIWR